MRCVVTIIQFNALLAMHATSVNQVKLAQPEQSLVLVGEHLRQKPKV